MSKASDYSDSYRQWLETAPKAPTRPAYRSRDVVDWHAGGTFFAEVLENGKLCVQLSTDPLASPIYRTLDPDDALAFGKWIVEMYQK